MRVALTFDAEHPSRPSGPIAQDELLAALAELELRATFFVQGRWATAYPATARAIAEAGHLIGNHSHHHVRMPFLNDVGLYEDVTSAQRAIVDTTGHDPRPWFRCPFGATDPRVDGRLAVLGYRNVLWHVDSRDFDQGETADLVASRVVTATERAGDGTIVLFHTWPAVTPPAVRASASRLLAAGAVFVRVDELGLPGPIERTRGPRGLGPLRRLVRGRAAAPFTRLRGVGRPGSRSGRGRSR